jgi:plasmid stabilization system protein ParE
MAVTPEQAKALAMAAARQRMAAAAAVPPAQPPQTSSDVWPWVKGAGDAALSMGAGMFTSPINHVAAAWDEYHDKPVSPAISPYEPKTPEGQAIGRKLGELLGPVANAIDSATGVNAPDAPHRVTGHLISAALDVLPGVDLARRTLAGARIAREALPATEDLRNTSQAAFKTAEQSGEILPREKLEDFVPKAEDALAAEAIDKTLHPNTFAALNKLQDEAIAPAKPSAKSQIIRNRVAARAATPEAVAAEPQTADDWIAGLAKAAKAEATPEELSTIGFSPKGAESIRRVLGDAEDKAFAESPPGRPSSDYRLAAKLKDQFDDFLDENMPATTEAGKIARQKWQQYRKSQDIDELIERAKNQGAGFTQSGMENALRTKFKQLADNPRRFSKYTPDEQAAILKVVRNDPLIFTARQLGKLSPVHGGIPALAEVLGSVAAPHAAIAAAGTGIAGKMLAEALRKGRAGAVSKLVRAGGNSEDVPGLIENMPGAETLDQVGNAPAYVGAAAPSPQDRARRLAAALGR